MGGIALYRACSIVFTYLTAALVRLLKQRNVDCLICRCPQTNPSIICVSLSCSSLFTVLVIYFLLACWSAGTAISSGLVVPML